MALKKSFRLLLVASGLFAPLAAQADLKAEFIAGGTCIPYPPSSGVSWQHWLYGFKDTAFCYLTATFDWPVGTLSYVLFSAWTTPEQVLTARLCVHGTNSTFAC